MSLPINGPLTYARKHVRPPAHKFRKAKSWGTQSTAGLLRASELPNVRKDDLRRDKHVWRRTLV